MQYIHIFYQSKFCSDIVEIRLTPQEYYDELETEDETYAQDGVPRHSNPLQYVPADADSIRLLVVSEPCEYGQKEFRIQQLDGERCSCIHSIWPDGTQELIHSTELAENTYHIIRTIMDSNGYWSMVVNDIIENDSVTSVNKNGLTYDQLQVFWQDFYSKRHT